MKQTAVEQLVQEINKLTGLNILMDEPCVIQAKEIEKEQIENAFNYGQFDLGMEADEYYNETFKSE
jgi:hypothetical protein